MQGRLLWQEERRDGQQLRTCGIWDFNFEQIFLQDFWFQNFKRFLFGLIKDLELVVCCLWGVVGLSVVVGAGLLGKVVRRLGRSVSTWKSELALMVLFERCLTCRRG